MPIPTLILFLATPPIVIIRCFLGYLLRGISAIRRRRVLARNFAQHIAHHDGCGGQGQGVLVGGFKNFFHCALQSSSRLMRAALVAVAGISVAYVFRKLPSIALQCLCAQCRATTWLRSTQFVSSVHRALHRARVSTTL